jgi:hypothetical protein
MTIRRSQLIRCCVCRQANVWGGRKLAILIQHGSPDDCVLKKAHCETCCVRVRRPVGEIERERREAEVAVNLVIFGRGG